MEMAKWVIDNRVPETPGIGIDFDEAPNPPELFAEPYRRARQADLRVTAHAGENGLSWRNVETALDVLCVERIEHGYTVLENESPIQRYAERGIFFTIRRIHSTCRR